MFNKAHFFSTGEVALFRRFLNNFTREHNGELGYGWTFDYQNAKVQESIEPSRGWYNHPEYQTFLIDTGDGGQTPFFMSGTCSIKNWTPTHS